MNVATKPQGLNATLKRFNEAQAKLGMAKRDLEEANRDLVKELVHMGMEDCLTPKVAMIRRRFQVRQD